MILINLLPHRQARRKQRRQAFFAMLGVSAVLGALLVGAWFTVLKQLTGAQQARNQFLTAEIARLDAQIKDIATLRADIEALQARQKAVEGLQIDRNTPVYLLDELVKQTPQGVFLNEVRQQQQSVLIKGMAQSNERVSEFLRNALHNSPWLEHPELVEIKAASIGGTGREQRRVSEFQMRLALKRQGPAPAASAADFAAANTPRNTP